MIQNQCIKAILERASIRGYSDKSLSSEQLDVLADCALASPTARDRKEQFFYFITDKSLIAEVEADVIASLVEKNETQFLESLKKRNNKVLYDTPLLIAISGRNDDKYAQINAGIAVQTLALAAKSMDLGSVILGMPNAAFWGNKKDYYSDKLGIPKEHEIMISIAIGYGTVDKAPHETNPSDVIYIND